MNNLGRNLGITEKEIRHMNSFLKGLLRRTRSRWEDNIKMDIKEIGINTSNWFDSAPDRDYWRALVNSALNLLVS